MEAFSTLNFSDHHSLPKEMMCNPSTGPQNVDGRCILGGELSNEGKPEEASCIVRPVFVLEGMPYHPSGKVSGSDYVALSTSKFNAIRMK